MVQSFILVHTSNLVAQAKANLRPPKADIEVTESCAKVKLQASLNNTCRRLLTEMSEEVLETILVQHQSNEFVMQVSWGFDGSAGQSNYKMQMNVDSSTSAGQPLADSSLFACTMIPLQIIQKGVTPEDELILWHNQVPQSVQFCRPISIEFAKETKELIRQCKADVDGQINLLVPYEFTLTKTPETFKVNFECYLTIIDGKALNVITNTDSSLSCPIFKATPKTFNVLSNIGTEKFRPKSLDNLKHGMHAYPRLFELVLHIAYRNDIKKWQARSQEEKMSVASKKKYLQQELYQHMCLVVDFPKSGGAGNSNDGNTARRAFKRYEEFGAITELGLFKRFRTIIVTFNHSLVLGADKFGDYCLETARLYVQKYPWYYMSATLHRILIHGKELVQSSTLP